MGIPRVNLAIRSSHVGRRELIPRNQAAIRLFRGTRSLQSAATNMCPMRAPLFTSVTIINPHSQWNLHGLQYRSFSATEKSPTPLDRPPISSSSLPLFSTVVEPFLATIQQLPEVQFSLEHAPSQTSMEGLLRAKEIFAQMNQGGNEHCAVLALLADVQSRIGLYSQARDTLTELQKHQHKDFHVTISMAKSQFFLGLFSDCSHTCQNELSKSIGILFDPLMKSTAQNAVGLTCVVLNGTERQRDPIEVFEEISMALLNLLNSDKKVNVDDHEPESEDDRVYTQDELIALAEVMNTEDQEDTTPPMEKVVRTDDQILLASAIGFNNLGIALVLNPQPDGDHMAAWMEGLEMLNRLTTESTLADTVRARLLLNLAIYLLNDGTESSLKTASGHAKEALRLCEGGDGLDSHEHHFLLGRCLSVVASCFVRADAAVTAEGLFQSSVEALKKGVGPLNQLALKETYHKYSLLYRNWDKRTSDAERLERERDMIVLPNEWNGKQEIMASIIFYGPQDL